MFRCIFTITSGAVTDESAVTVPASPNAGVINNLPGYCVRVFLSLLPFSCLTLPLFVMDTKIQGILGLGVVVGGWLPRCPSPTWKRVTGCFVAAQTRGGRSPAARGSPDSTAKNNKDTPPCSVLARSTPG